MTKKVIVVGAGAAGMLAAGQAALGGAKVQLHEKQKQAGSKILISGKGRCNLTNNSDLSEFLKHYNRNGRFLHQPFSFFFVTQLMDFFSSIGLKLVTERGNRVFPAEGNAHDVVTKLTSWLDTIGVGIKYNSSISSLVIEEGRVVGVRCGRKRIAADAVILATGGCSYPATGSSGDGYRFAENAGHSIVPLRPALIPLTVNEIDLSDLAGLDLKNVGLRIFVDGTRKKVDFGEIGFTRFGIGGPLILKHSLFVVDSLRQGSSIEISLDLKPALEEKKLDRRLQRDFQQRHNEEIGSVLRGLLPKPLVPSALFFAHIDANTLAGQIKSKSRKRLGAWLKNFRLPVSGHRPLKEAIVTAGGVNIKEVDPKTMESKLTGGLYLTGELLDIHGETGGYNLQAAFSTGWLAGRSAAIFPRTDQE